MYRLPPIFSPFSRVPFALSRSMRYGLTLLSLSPYSFRWMVSIMSLPLKTNMRHCSLLDGLRASGGSWYLRTVLVPATVFASLASSPVALKLGFCFSTTGSAGTASSPWRN
ncbi:hypothetical protein KCV07_g427, partial [Aureobasidium melanogenum]